MLQHVFLNKYGINRLLEGNVGKFPQWNLSLLNLEQIEDNECIEAINDSIFPHLFKFTTEMGYSDLMDQLMRKGGIYGIDGFHPGFGDLLADLLTQDIFDKHVNQSKPVLRGGKMCRKILQTHIYGI